MVECLDSLDRSIFLFLNGMHNDFFDVFMWYVSKTATWSLMLLFLLYIIFKNNWRMALMVVLGIALTITLADQISSGLIKDFIGRFRPTHNPEIESIVHTVNGYKGGLYGFVSSHAANTLGVAVYISLLFRNRYITLFMMLWSLLVAYSRIYLGVHYPGDILGGMIVGVISGFVVYKIYDYAILRLKLNEKNDFFDKNKKNTKIMCCGILSNLLITVGGSAILCFLA